MLALWRSLLLLGVLRAAVRAEDPEADDKDAGEVSAEEIMMQGDTDGDGKLSLEELLREAGEDEDPETIAVYKSVFKQSDKDGDGMVGLDELPDMIKNMDMHDGMTRDEM
mmetsp:Transcript_73528/g.207686  ORF Transcript_73528/g.207686 Transcript_73528/m.207686 type:complete len:110 (-) Transcript_73528:57-386(-)